VVVFKSIFLYIWSILQSLAVIAFYFQFIYLCVVDKGRTSAVNGDVMNGELVSGEITPSSDGDSVTLDASSDGDTAVTGSRVYKQDVITVTGRRENCEAARDAMLVCISQQQ